MLLLVLLAEMKPLELLAMKVEVPVLEAVLETLVTLLPLTVTELAALGPPPMRTQSALAIAEPPPPPSPPPPVLPALVTGAIGPRAVTLPPAPVTDAVLEVTAAPPTPAAAETQTPPVLQADAAAAPAAIPTTVAISSTARQRPRMLPFSRSSVHGPFTSA